MESTKTINQYTYTLKVVNQHIEVFVVEHSTGASYKGVLELDRIQKVTGVKLMDINVQYCILVTKPFHFYPSSHSGLRVEFEDVFFHIEKVLDLVDTPEPTPNADPIDEIVAPELKKSINITDYSEKLKNIKVFEKMIIPDKITLSEEFWKSFFTAHDLIWRPSSKAISPFLEFKIQLILQYFDGLKNQKCSLGGYNPAELGVKNVCINKILNTMEPTTMITVYTDIGDFPVSLEDFQSRVRDNTGHQIYLHKDYVVLTNKDHKRIASISLDRNQMYKFLVVNCGTNLLF